MRDIINWLIDTEERARKVYEKSASVFSGDEGLCDLLVSLGEDEKEHGQLIHKASELTMGASALPELVSLDEDIKKKVAYHFLLCEQELETSRLTKEIIIDFIVSTEYSEWNDLFVYVTNTLKHRYREFIPVAANIQRHKRNVERFLESRPEFGEYLRTIRKIPRIWTEKLLVVDDEPFITDVVAALLGDEGIIDTAADGEKALEMLAGAYYAAIITDVDMPVMTGLGFYEKAIGKYPNIKDRFLFFTGSLDDERTRFFKENGLKCLQKPAGIYSIKSAVIDILNKTPKSS